MCFFYSLSHASKFEKKFKSQIPKSSEISNQVRFKKWIQSDKNNRSEFITSEKWSDSINMSGSINMGQLHFARDELAPDVFAELDPPQMTRPRTWFEISLELGLGLKLCLALDVVTHSKGKRNTIRFSCPSRSVVIEYSSLNLCDLTDFAYAGWIWSLHIEQIGQFERPIKS